MRIGSGDVFVRRTGDTMTGALTVDLGSAAGPALITKSTAAHRVLSARVAGSIDWELYDQGVEPRLMILDAVIAQHFSLRLDNSVIGTATMPLSGIGASGSVTVSNAPATAWGAVNMATGLASTQIIATYHSNDSVVNSSTGFAQTDNVGSTSAAAGVNVNNAAIMTTVSYTAGTVAGVFYNAQATAKTVTTYWTAIGR